MDNREVEKIKAYLRNNKITYEELAKRANMSIGTIKSIFSGRTPNPRIDTLRIIREALGLDERNTLFDNIFSFDNIEPLPEYDIVPLLGTIACGTPIFAEENIEDYIQADKRLKASFTLRCKGDSMINARIFDGDIVYIRQQDDVENGEIAAVLIENEATLKRVYKYENRIELRPENPTFAPINIEGEQLQTLKILGKAVAFISMIR